MARIRTIKPEFFTSIPVAGLPYEARLTFIGLWTHVDDSGRCVDDVRLIRAALWPLDDRTFGDVEKDLDALADASLVRRYSIGGRRYLQVSGWSEHQRISKPTRSKLPPPPLPESSGSAPGEFREDSGSAPIGPPEDSAGERKGKEQGREGIKPVTRARGDDAAGISNGVALETPIAPTQPWQPPRKRWCDEHGHPNDKDCDGCYSEHHDAGYWSKLPEGEYKRRSAARFAAGEA